MWGARQFLVHHPVQFLQFLHQIALGVLAACRINEKVIGLARQRGGHRVVRDGGRVSAIIAGDDRHIQTLSPEFELLNRGGAEGVAGGEQRGLAARLNQVRELGARGCLAGAVDAYDGDDRRTAGCPEQRRWV